MITPPNPPPGDGQSGRRVHLTTRQMDVLRRIAAGHSNGQIAADLVLAEDSVKHIVSQIRGALGITYTPGARVREQIVAEARQRDLL